MKTPAMEEKMEPEKLMEGAEEAKEFNKVTKDLIREASRELINPTKQKRGEDWSVLSNQVVGSEKF